ncbi:MAG: glycosyltransferase [candidate division Zixibacteria bacterium]|nr:glycosyltransferase [candidate division Zixibacteria bacterium]
MTTYKVPKTRVPADKEVSEPELSIVMPCLNEAETLHRCIKKAQRSIRRHNLRAEIIVADNGSTDGSTEIAQACGARVVPVEAKGYGAALGGGIEAAQGRYIIMGDADDSYDFSNIFPFIEKLREGHDLVMGCRLPSGGGTVEPGAMPWKHRWIGNPVLTGIGRLFFRSPISDFHCGLRAFRKEAYQNLDMRTTGMEFASEMVIKATLKKMRVSQIPITLHKDGRSRPPHLRSWRDGWRHLRFMLMYSPRWLFLFPGIIGFLAGAFFFALLLHGPLRVGTAFFDTNTLLVSAMAIILSFQLISFAMFTKIFAISEGLLPEDPRLNRLFCFITLEVGILIGLIFAASGLGLLISAFLYWAKLGFGELSYPDSLRIVIPAVTSLTLGVQIIFSSFFMSILGLKTRKQQPSQVTAEESHSSRPNRLASLKLVRQKLRPGNTKEG